MQVIFDEVHYVNDVDRGVVWEEVRQSYVLLSWLINLAVILSETIMVPMAISGYHYAA